jgi:NAD-reducing hydrogenase large subunit
MERMEQLLTEPEILSKRVRASERPNCLEGVGGCETPRGTLFHHYKIDEQGLIRWAQLMIAAAHNIRAMRRGILQVGKHFAHGSA